MAEQLWNTMSDILGPCPTVPIVNGIPVFPENLHLIGVNAWQALSGMAGDLQELVAQFRLPA